VFIVYVKPPHITFIMAVENLSIVLAERPTGEIIPGTTFHQKVSPAPTPADLKDGEILVEALYLSLDPAMRGWLNGKIKKINFLIDISMADIV
jgi:NADPH-dependent curcumin reductase CurA